MASPKAIILVTGANSGVGYEVSKLLATTSSSYHVLICGRTLAKAEQAHLDVLINNAGIIGSGTTLTEQLQNVLNTNTIAQASLTEAVKPLLKVSPNPWILFISSLVGSITLRCDPTSKSYSASAIAHRTSKAALNMLAACYAKEWKEEFGCKVWAVCPGLVATNLTGDAKALRARGALEPSTSAQTILNVVKGKRC